MKILPTGIILILIFFVMLGFVNKPFNLNENTISCTQPVGILSGPPANLYDFTSTTGTTFDIQLSNANFNTLLENLINVSDATPQPGIQIVSSVLNTLPQGTYQWRAKDHADTTSSFSSACTFIIP